jgi:hypothetical protein
MISVALLYDRRVSRLTCWKGCRRAAYGKDCDGECSKSSPHRSHSSNQSYHRESSGEPKETDYTRPAWKWDDMGFAFNSSLPRPHDVPGDHRGPREQASHCRLAAQRTSFCVLVQRSNKGMLRRLDERGDGGGRVNARDCIVFQTQGA